MPASASCAWACSHITARFAASSSSQRRAETYGLSSESGLTGAYSVHTAPQPPSAFIARCAAWANGLVEPSPVQWGTW